MYSLRIKSGQGFVEAVLQRSKQLAAQTIRQFKTAGRVPTTGPMSREAKHPQDRGGGESDETIVTAAVHQSVSSHCELSCLLLNSHLDDQWHLQESCWMLFPIIYHPRQV